MKKSNDLHALVIVLLIGIAWVATRSSDASAETELEACRRLAPKYNAQCNVRTEDGAWCDLLTKELAIEVDWAEKWAEGIGQALYYGLCFKRQPAVILLIKDPEQDESKVARCRKVCEAYGVKLILEKSDGDP